MEKTNRNRKVVLNEPIKICYSDGSKIAIRIFDQKPGQLHNSPEYFVHKDSPIAKAVLGHKVGDKVEYIVGENRFSVTILDC